LKVYVIFSSDYECTDIVSIHSTKEGAKKARKNYIKKARNNPVNYPMFVKADFVEIKEMDVLA